MKITIGKSEHKNVAFDLDVLLTSRLLITANSGAGKSWLLRKLMEELFGHVQVIGIDPEGEFATLREKFDYALVGKGGDIPADVRIAGDVAEKLLELRLSAVCDLYEMKPAERHEWVAKFLFALVNAPKKLWHPAIIIVDEAQMFCPEKGAGESVAAEAMEDLTGRGRKRGFCAVWATQKLSNLRKSATTNMLNRLVGGTFEDVDVKRALDLLGVLTEDKDEVKQQLRTLEPGYFYAFGRAVSKERVLFRVGQVETSHPQPGSAKHAAEPPPAPEKIKAVLAKLAEIPHTAEEKARTLADLKKQLAEATNRAVAAERELKRAQSAAPAASLVKAKVADPAMIQRAVKHAIAERDKQWHSTVRGYHTQLVRLISESQADLQKIVKAGGPPLPEDFVLPAAEREAMNIHRAPAANTAPVPTRTKIVPPAPRPRELAENNGRLSNSQQRILSALAQFEAIGRAVVPKKWIAALAGASHSSGNFRNNLGALRSGGYIDYPQPERAALTEHGRAAAPAVEAPASPAEMLERCKEIVSSSQASILDVLAAHYPTAIEKSQVAELVRASAESGNFRNNLGALRSAGMIEYPSPGTAKLASWVMLEDER